MSLKILTRAIIYTTSEKINGKYNVLIIGAGDCASTIMTEIRKEKSDEYNIVGIIDDNKSKIGNYLNGVKILGDRNDIAEIVEKENIDEIFFAIAKINGEERAKILDICSNTKAKIKVIPGYYQLLEEGISFNKMRYVDLKDLIGREEVKLDKVGIELGDKKELVTQEDLPYIISDVLKHDGMSNKVKLKSYFVTLAHGLKPMATLSIEIDGQVYEESSSGDGQYDAFVRALRKVYKVTLGRKFPMLINYAVSIPPGGRTDAFVQTVITWSFGEKVFRTRGLDADQTEAAIKATIKMLNIIEEY